ncbi:MAG: asparagine synthase (glutamine-hydrolyzing) [Proteobacteria bacterium]|nr:asparagine synthase (glutamine-hydrolyzing) [Pseudomonadota bacterium]
MCGIVAILGRRGQAAPAASLDNAIAALEHRGPDDSGEFRHNNLAFGFRRLAIIDLSAAGHQPMTSMDGALTIIFNGEIYNYLELRRELQLLGQQFQTASDTEVLLAAYRQWGAECVHRLNGMWAFLIFDRASGTIFGSRDRLGVKPLYLWESDDWLVLASEPNAIRATGLCAVEPNWARLADSLARDALDHSEATCIAGISRLPAGSRVWINPDGSRRVDRFWRASDYSPDEPPRADADYVERLGHLLSDSIRLRMRSDVPVGFTLSGGIDSTLLICEAARLAPAATQLNAFSYQDDQFNESHLIELTLRQSGARLVSIANDNLDLSELLPEVLRAHGEPLHSPAEIANYELFRLARQHGVKVVIGGQGADEVLCGYHSFQNDYWYSLADDGHWNTLRADINRFAQLHGRSANALLLQSLRRFAQIRVGGIAGYRRVANRFGPQYPQTALSSLFNPDLMRRSTRSTMVPADFRLTAQQQRAIAIEPLPLYLRTEDRSSMAHSVEARLPFMDYRVVEHALRIPGHLKYSGGLNKVALRRVAAGRIPAEISARVQKFGFPVSASQPIAYKLHTLGRELITSQEFRERGIYAMQAVENLIRDFHPNDPTHVSSVFHLIQTELWLRSLRGNAGMFAARSAA